MRDKNAKLIGILSAISIISEDLAERLIRTRTTIKDERRKHGRKRVCKNRKRS